VHITFSATTKPTDTEVDTWCTVIDAVGVALWPTATNTANFKTLSTVMAIHHVMMPLYRKGEFNGFANSSGGEQGGGYQYGNPTELYPPFILNLMNALEGGGDYVSFDPY
jgi:hypothetical protein